MVLLVKANTEARVRNWIACWGGTLEEFKHDTGLDPFDDDVLWNGWLYRDEDEGNWAGIEPFPGIEPPPDAIQQEIVLVQVISDRVYRTKLMAVVKGDLAWIENDLLG